MAQVEHNDFTALIAIMETFATVVPEMPVGEAWAKALETQDKTRTLANTALSAGMSTGTPPLTAHTLPNREPATLARWIYTSTEPEAAACRTAVHDSKKIVAIKELRSATSTPTRVTDLKAAKEGVEAYEAIYLKR